jgi:elongation factor 2
MLKAFRCKGSFNENI